MTAESVSLATERAPLGQPGLSSGRHAEHRVAARADHDGLRVREHGCDGEASLALDVHEITVGALYQALELVGPLLELGSRMQKINVARKHLKIGKEEGGGRAA